MTLMVGGTRTWYWKLIGVFISAAAWFGWLAWAIIFFWPEICRDE
jgi:hypothetical protein